MRWFFKITSSISGIALAFFILSANAYSPHYTHPDLTEEMIKFYNSAAEGKKIGNEFVTTMRQGSIDEDTVPRWINHFYDPQTGEGWTGEHLGPHDKETVQQASKTILAIGFTPMPAPEWATDQSAQNLFINYGWNHTWQKAIYDYVIGDEEKSFESLGYVLHLIEDMSVPDHTRNDSHPHVAGDPGSPYEEWAQKYTNSHKLDTAEGLLGDKSMIPNFSNLREAFDYTAKYSNENFFSEETINGGKYLSPKVTRFETQEEFTYAFGILDQMEASLYKFKNQDISTATLLDERILSAYFSRLSRRATLAGAGTIDLFFREVEKAKQNPELLETPPPIPNSLGTIGTYFYTRMVSPYGMISAFTEPIANAARAIKKTPLWWQERRDAFKQSMFSAASALYGSSVTLDDLENGDAPLPPKAPPSLLPAPTENNAEKTIITEAISATNDSAINEPQIVRNPISKNNSANTLPENRRENSISNAAPKSNESSAASAVSLLENIIAAVPQFIPSLTPDPATIGGGFAFGGGGSGGGGLPPGAGAAPNQANDTETGAAPASANQPSNQSSGGGSSNSSNEQNNQQENQNDSSSDSSDQQSDQADQEGNSGDNSQENSENEEEQGPPSPPPDTTPPDIIFSISECENASIAGNGCLLLNGVINLSWSSTATDTDHFEIACLVDGAPCAGFLFSSTTVASAAYGLEAQNKTYSFAAKSVDAAGNKSDAITKTAEFSAMPVVINEIAWMGTGSSNTANKDEWIELYNKTARAINLSDWSLAFYAPGTTTPSHSIALSGSISAKGFYLIERTDDNAVADVAADITSSFGSSGLLNSGMIVKLEQGGAVVDRTPNLCSGAWCAGSSQSYATMERDNPFVEGSGQSNWGTHGDLGANIKNGTNVEGGTINGTPKQRNSRNYLIAPSALTQSKTLTKENSPYIIPASASLTINAGATLTAEPGVVIKFAASAGMTINGKLVAVGTVDDRIIFTSIHDDANGGDTNQNGASTAPSPGDWTRMRFVNASEASQLDYATVRYGGPKCGFACPSVENLSMLYFFGSPVEIHRSIIEYSLTSGAWMKDATGIIADTTFRNVYTTWQGVCQCALGLSGGGVTTQGNVFENNKIGLHIVSGSHAISGNTFTNNSGDAIQFSGGTPSFSGNTALGNAQNGITLLSAITSDYTFEKDLPYIGGPSVESGKTAIVKPGVVFKNTGAQSVRGILKAEGSAADPIVFTSLKDDANGGDTNNDGVCDSGNASSTASCPKDGDWASIKFFAGASGSFLKHALIRYGGSCNLCGGFPSGSITISGSAIEIADSIFEKNKAIGLWLANSATTTVSSTIIRGHKSIGLAEGMRLENSKVVLDGVTFSENSTAITGDNLSQVTLGSGGATFSGNTADDFPSTLIP